MIESLWVNPKFIAFLLGEDNVDDEEELISDVYVEGWVEYKRKKGQKLKERVVI